MGRPKMTEEEKAAAKAKREAKSQIDVESKPEEKVALVVAKEERDDYEPSIELPIKVSEKTRKKIISDLKGIPSDDELDRAFAISDASDEDHPQDHEPRPLLEKQYLREKGSDDIVCSWRKFSRIDYYANKDAKWREAIMPSTGKVVDSEGQRLLVTTKANKRKGMMRPVIDSRRQMGINAKGSIGQNAAIKENTEKKVRMTVQGNEPATLQI